MNTNFKVIGLTGLGIKPESTAQETDALYHSAILSCFYFPHGEFAWFFISLVRKASLPALNVKMQRQTIAFFFFCKEAYS